LKKPANPPEVDAIIIDLLEKGKMPTHNIDDAKGRYVHWDKLRFLSPVPEGLTSKEWWAAIKYIRRGMYKNISINDQNGKPFVFAYTEQIMKDLHWLDLNILDGSSRLIDNSEMKNTYLIGTLIEESISSSQLEGAATTRVVAKEMLRKKRKPSDKNEQMIYNNYHAMQFIREYQNENLTEKILLELQKILTENTLENEEHSGSFRTVNDEVNVVNKEGDILHAPPSAEFIEEKMRKLYTFSNEVNYEIFIHPIIKAIILHFLIGYEHPFNDGNGRTARALFYWSIAKQNYRLMEYISISRIIKKSPIQYGKAYLYTETDENDMTYFIEYHIKVIRQALEDLYDYIKKKRQEIEDTEKLFMRMENINLNYRQLSLIKHAMRHPGCVYTILEHKNRHDVVYDTARLDLVELSDKYHFLNKEKKGAKFVFKSPLDLTKIIYNKATK
jgi:Fic family protein